MNLALYVIEQINRGERSYDISSRLLGNGIVMLNEEVNNVAASLMVAQPLYLEGQDPSKDTSLYISSPGDFVTVGLAIYDTMQYIKCDASMICIGMAAPMGTFLLAAGAKDKRFAPPSSEIMIHQPSDDTRGRAADIMIHADHVIATKRKLNKILAEKTGQPTEVIMRDTEHDNLMTVEQTAVYGLADKAVAKR